MKLSKIIKYFFRFLFIGGLLAGIGYVIYLFVRQCIHAIPALINEFNNSPSYVVPVGGNLCPADVAVLLILLVFGGTVLILGGKFFIDWVFSD